MEKEIYKGCDQECFECCYSECRIPANLISLGEKKAAGRRQFWWQP